LDGKPQDDVRGSIPTLTTRMAMEFISPPPKKDQETLYFQLYIATLFGGRIHDNRHRPAHLWFRSPAVWAENPAGWAGEERPHAAGTDEAL